MQLNSSSLSDEALFFAFEREISRVEIYVSYFIGNAKENWVILVIARDIFKSDISYCFVRNLFKKLYKDIAREFNDLGIYNYNENCPCSGLRHEI